MDRISKLPSTLIESILCLVPIQEAARTSILCKEWRYHWTKIPKLAFSEYSFEVSSYGDELSPLEEMFDHTKVMRVKRCKLLYAIHQVLLKHEGSIDEFSLSMISNKRCVEIDYIISYLSKNKAVKKLKLDLYGYKLPSSLFKFDHLTDLFLGGCHLDHQPTFKGFYYLTSLYIKYIATSKSALLHFLSGCPLLKSLILYTDNIKDTGDSAITNLFECLPMVENLCIWHTTMKCFAQNGVPRMLTSPLVHLKCLHIHYMDLEYGLPFILLLIRSSPNLEKLTLEVFECFDDYDKCSYKDYPDIWLPRLNKFEIVFWYHKKLELDFVKLILATSPVLKKAKILLCEDIDEDEEQRVLRIILSSQRASPVVDVLVERENLFVSSFKCDLASNHYKPY